MHIHTGIVFVALQFVLHF